MVLKKIKRKYIWLALLLGLFPLQQASSQNVTPDEVKASYILKMRPFISVGNPPHSFQTICYYEKPGIPWRESVGQIIGRYIDQHPDPHAPVSVQWFKAIRDFSGCDLFYIPAEEEGNVDSILAALDSSSTLTVSGTQQFIFKGGMIGFVLDDANRVKMVANLKNIKAKAVRIDAQLLEIMQQVVGQ